ncbi:MAG: tRNA (cytidine(34)-2'-O)-methyltransferase [Mycoplasmatales bacterium]
MRVHIVLYQPEIPPNTANIMRSCVATDSKLHLIEPLGFDLNMDQKVFKRSSTNFKDLVDFQTYKDFDNFIEINKPKQLYFITRYGETRYDNMNIDIKEDVYIIFGNESSGIPKEILTQYKGNLLRIPMNKNMRSLNLSNCVLLLMYEALKRDEFNGLEVFEPHKIDYLK